MQRIRMAIFRRVPLLPGKLDENQVGHSITPQSVRLNIAPRFNTYPQMKVEIAYTRYDESTVVIILNVPERVVGAVVDSVSDVYELTRNQARPAPEFNSTVAMNVITGPGSVTQSD
jgi:hypothetical protein